VKENPAEERPGRKKNTYSYRLSGDFFVTTIGKTTTLPNGITLASSQRHHEKSPFFQLVGQAIPLPLNFSGLR